jgi:site-specific recombinase XerC
VTDQDCDLLEAWRFDVSGRVSGPIQREHRRYLDEFRRDVGPLTTATTFQLRRFMIDRSDRWGPSTMQICRRAFRSFYGWAVGTGVVAENPALGVPTIKAPEVAVRVATDDIRTKLVAAARGERDVAIIAVIFGSGARRSEMAALRVGDVQAVVGTIFIARSKTARPRTSPIDRPAREALAAWLTVRAGPSTTTDALWTTPDGAPLTGAGLKTMLRRTAERAGVTWTSHDSRRFAATEWIRRGGSQVGLETALGWRPGSIMVAKYTRMNAEELAIGEHRRLFG